MTYKKAATHEWIPALKLVQRLLNWLFGELLERWWRL